MAEKLRVIEAHERGATRSELMTQYDLKKSTLHDILKAKEHLKAVVRRTEGVGMGGDAYRPRKLQHEILDDAVNEWCTRERAEGRLVSDQDTQHAAERLATELGFPGVKFDDPWVWRFRRHCIVQRAQRAVRRGLRSAGAGAGKAAVGEQRCGGEWPGFKGQALVGAREILTFG